MWRDNFEGERGDPLWSIENLCHNVCKNGWTDWDGVAEWSGPKEACIRWASRSPCAGAILRGKWAAHFEDLLPWAVRKWLNRLRCLWDMDSDRPKEACVKWRCTLVPPGEYDWTIHVQRWCGLFVDLIWPLVYCGTNEAVNWVCFIFSHTHTHQILTAVFRVILTW